MPRDHRGARCSNYPQWAQSEGRWASAAPFSKTTTFLVYSEETGHGLIDDYGYSSMMMMTICSGQRTFSNLLATNPANQNTSHGNSIFTNFNFVSLCIEIDDDFQLFENLGVPAGCLSNSIEHDVSARQPISTSTRRMWRPVSLNAFLAELTSEVHNSLSVSCAVRSRKVENKP